MRQFSMPILGRCFVVIALAVIGCVAAPRAASAQNVDMKKMFRCQAKDRAGIAACDKARGLILNNCTSCHVFVAIVVQQFDQQGWDGLFARHAPRVPQLDKKTLDEMKAYLVANFNPKLDPPDVPPELLKAWTSY